MLKENRRKPQKEGAASPYFGLTPLPSEVFGVAFGIALPLLRKVIRCKDRRNWAYRDAGTAIDTFDWIDVEHLLCSVRSLVLFRMNAIHRACVYAS